MLKNPHVKLRFRKPADQERFKKAMDIVHGWGLPREVCEKCGGEIWPFPRLSPRGLKVLGRQLGIKVRVMQYKETEKCNKETPRVVECVRC